MSNKNRNTNNETYNYIKYLHRKSFDLFFNITKPVSDAHPKISAIELNVNVNPRKNLKSIRDFNCPQSQKKTKLFFSLHNVALTRLWSYFYCTIVSYYCHLFSNPFSCCHQTRDNRMCSTNIQQDNFPLH